ncbi:MAG: TRAP transporter substrate-binding protein DctP, partial [Rhodospirillales bacterium]|nr:TRAP transporter substrate-binding protein DctP [Rhodospirillales bacterium]
ALEVAHTSIGGITPFIPELAVVDLQYLLPGDDVVYKFMEGSFTDKMAAAIQKKLSNVRLVGVSDGGRWRSFFTTKEVHDATDMKGMKIRTINSPLQQEFVRKLGAAATPVAWGELYTALATGQVEGTKNATPDIISNKFNEVVKYVILDRHTFLFGYYFISDSWLGSLPADLQTVVLNGFSYATKKQTTFNKDVEDSANARFVKGGGKLHTPSEADRATFTGARDAMKDWYVGKYGDKWLKDLVQAVDEAKAQAGYIE